MSDPAAVQAWVREVRAWTQYTTFAANQVEAVELLCLALDQIDILAAEVQAMHAKTVGQLDAENQRLRQALVVYRDLVARGRGYVRAACDWEADSEWLRFAKMWLDEASTAMKAEGQS